MAAAIAKDANEGLNLIGKTVVLSGGTQGIGAATAVRFAALGVSRIILIGRNENAAKAIIEQARAASVTTRPFTADFVKADLGTIQGFRDAAKKVEELTGPKGVDYLLETQGKTPNGLYVETADGLESDFAVQALSRFGLAYLLASRRVIKDGGAVLTILSPGASVAQLDLNDLSLKKESQTKWRIPFLVAQANRTGTITDAWTEELGTDFPTIRFYHVFPGFVSSNIVANSALPFPANRILPVVGWLALKAPSMMGGSTPEGYAEVPIYLLSNPKAEERHGKARRFDQFLRPVEIGAYNKSPEARQQLVAKLKELVGRP